jgi:CxxC motif-containing protein
LEFASDELKNDREVVFAAVINDGSALRYASAELKNDREIVMAALKEDSYAFVSASEELKNDKEVVLAALKNRGDVMRYISEALKNDREIVIAALKVDASALQYASDELKNDREIVIAALKVDASALQYASDELKNDREFLLSIMDFSKDALKYASSQMRKDLQIKESIVTSFEIINNDKIDVRFFESNEHKLQVAFKDLENKMTWDEANSACVKLGEGWRLPNLDELQKMSKELYECNMGNFQSRYLSEYSPAYWSNCPSIKEVYGGAVWSFAFINPDSEVSGYSSDDIYKNSLKGVQNEDGKGARNYVRAVRSI